eukprot:TRINITY_DN39653_c0_g1_i1.p2 TRINITY_DN39653_c0_g1~~TRINITY_DN39653_c0_g1_i1.p2  ORF type:complete len:169 (+),score=50.28 TRINITY_DN39653_c0_g1_i1:60-566(+)
MSIFFPFAPNGLPDKLVSMTPPVLTPIQGVLGTYFTAYLPQVMRAALTPVFSGKAYDNVNPRMQTAAVMLAEEGGGMFGRLQSAHVNGLENLPVFGLSVLFALTAGVDKVQISRIATLHVLLRTLYNVLYVFGKNQAVAGIRSLAYIGAALCSFKLFYLARKKQQMAW